METKRNKIFPKPVLAEPPVSHGVTPWVELMVQSTWMCCLGVSFITFKGHLCMLPFASSPLKDVYSPLPDELAPPGLSLALSAAWVPSLVFVDSQLEQKKKLIRSAKFASPVGPGRETFFSSAHPPKSKVKPEEMTGNFTHTLGCGFEVLSTTPQVFKQRTVFLAISSESVSLDLPLLCCLCCSRACVWAFFSQCCF